MGTINNVEVAGNLNQLVIPSFSDTSPGFADRMSSIYDYSDKLGSLVEILTGAATVLIMFKNSKAAERQIVLDEQGEAQSEADAKAKELKIKEDYNAKFQFHLSEKQLATEDEASQALSTYDEVAVAQNVLKDMTLVAKEGEKLEQILNDGGANSDIEETASDLADAKDILAKAKKSGTSVTEAQADVKQAANIVADTSENMENEVQSEDNTVSQDEKEAEQDVTKVDDEIKAQAEDTEKVEEDEQAKDNKAASDNVDSKNFGDAKQQN